MWENKSKYVGGLSAKQNPKTCQAEFSTVYYLAKPQTSMYWES